MALFAVETAGGKCLPCAVDIRDEDTVNKAVQDAVKKFGGIDILVNNASAISLTGTLDTPMKRCAYSFSLNKSVLNKNEIMIVATDVTKHLPLQKLLWTSSRLNLHCSQSYVWSLFLSEKRESGNLRNRDLTGSFPDYWLVTEPKANVQTILGSLKLKIKAKIQICLEWYLLQSNNRSLVYFVLSCQTNWKISNSDHLDSWFSRHVLFNEKHSLISKEDWSLY